jgi:Protein of unknown function (DUF2778)
MGKANLTYYIFEGVLVGTVGGEQIHILALSGGGGATRRKEGPTDPNAVNNPYRTGQVKVGNARGGPIPLGRYDIRKPAPWHKGWAARLDPVDPRGFLAATGRGGFLIHGRGPLGSDGCIVPLVPSQFQALMHGLEKDDGGALTVLESFGDARFA